MGNFREKEKKAIRNFVIKNYPGNTKEEIKEIVDYHMARYIGSKHGLTIILKEGEGFKGIDKKGNFIDF